MNGRDARWLVTVGVAAVLTIAGCCRWRAARLAYALPSRMPTPATPNVPPGPTSMRSDTIDAALDALEAHDPFAREASRANGQAPVVISPSVTLRAPRPALVLRGVVGADPSWRAILDGVPGSEGGVLLAAGDSVGGLRVRRVTADSAIVFGADTTWRLGVQRAW